ncbi:hypothetical protein ACIG5E_20685 [Kitasatospora sp. NPDC053057]
MHVSLNQFPTARGTKPVVQLLVCAAGLTTGSPQPSNRGVVFSGP